MATLAEPAAQLQPLPNADGSATFSHSDYTVVSSVNGPMEAQRRDEDAFAAIVDVVVRPAAGVGGTAERQLESILQAALAQLILLRDFPRCVFQVTLQILSSPQNAYANARIMQPLLDLSVIPPLLHASILGLLAANVPMKSIATATFLAVMNGEKDSVVVDPSPTDARRASSLHVCGFNGSGELLMQESQGSFSIPEWAAVLQAGETVCCQSDKIELDESSENKQLWSSSIRNFIRSIAQQQVTDDLSWKS